MSHAPEGPQLASQTIGRFVRGNGVNAGPLRIRTSTVMTLLTMSPLIFAVLIGLKHYEIWDQITYLWDNEVNPIRQLGRTDAHALRYAIIYPVLVIADALDLHHDTLFSAVLLVFCFFTIRNIHASTTVVLRGHGHSPIALFLSASLLVMLFFLMNGRIGYAFLGYSMVLLVIVRHNYDRQFGLSSFATVLVGLVLSSVSSGTLVSTTLCLSIGIYFEACRCIARTKVTLTAFGIFLACLILGALLFRYLMVGIDKNITYYGGGPDGILRMLEHGFGRSVYPALSAAGLPSVAVLVTVIAILFAAIMFRMRHALLLHVLLAALVCGAFGYSTLTLAAIPLAVLASVTLSTWMSTRRFGAASP